MMLQSLLPAFLPVIRKHLNIVEPFIVSYLQQYQPRPGEKGITLMLDLDGEKAYVAIVAIDADNTVVRLISRERVSKFIEQLLKSAQQSGAV
ncbi:MAG: hypothetical protein LBU42_01560 [Prevotellaceae bacterium]|jgi:hypothetical protein|nr:hypothetical protein [Prevotellaceae bacterium]